MHEYDLLPGRHGDKDPLVPHNQSEMLHEALKNAGVETTFYTVQGGGHSGFKDPNIQLVVAKFFKQHLDNWRQSNR